MPISGESCSSPEDLPAPAHNPLAPLDESFDISTTVDPSFVISLIRKLVPSDLKTGGNTIESSLHEEEPKNEDTVENAIRLSENGKSEAEETVDIGGKENGPKTINGRQHQGVSSQEKTWEECGCILWDLAASKDHAQLMAQNLIIDVLLANLMVSKSARISEISLGIIGNLACHEILLEQISSSNGLIKLIVNQLFLDDVPCLCEAFRVIITFIRKHDRCVIWAEALQAEQTLSRILWISENTNFKLLKKSARFFFNVIYGGQVRAILLPPMMRLGLSSVLVNLLAFVMSKFHEEEKAKSDEVLDLILLSIEALSKVDDYGGELFLNKQLLQLLEDLVKFHDKSEIPNACVDASNLLAKILVGDENLASRMSQDLDILQGTLDVFPFTDCHLLTQESLWSIIAKSLALVQESEMTLSFFNRLVSILSSKSDIMIEEVEFHFLSDMDDDPPPPTLADLIHVCLKKIASVLILWQMFDDETKLIASMEGYHINEEDVDKLLQVCGDVFTVGT